MRFEKRKLESLKHAEYNPRVKLSSKSTEYQKIKRSILEFGYVEPIIINNNDMIISGHRRTDVLFDLGYDVVDVIIIDGLTEQQEKALNVALNKITGLWDNEKLFELLNGLENSNYDYTLTGFDEKEFNSLISEAEKALNIEDNEFDVSEALDKIKEPFTKEGYLYKLGNHRLLCGDATNWNNVELLTSGKLMDLALTDPPYNVDYVGKTEDALKIENDNMPDDEFEEFIFKTFSNLKRTCKQGAAVYIFHSDSIGEIFRRAFKKAEFDLKQVLIWVKNHFVLGRQDYQWQHEPILYGYNPGAAHYFVNDRSQSTILEFDKPLRNEEHPTMKPVPLIAQLIKNNTLPDESVIDIFGGSGPTLIACEELKRNCYIMDITPKYCDVIIKRYINYCEQNNKKPTIELIQNGEAKSVDINIFI